MPVDNAPRKAGEAPGPPGVRPSARYYPEVEGLRGLAVSLVVLHHAYGTLRPGMALDGAEVSLPMAFVFGGQTGVSLFFVLSAFCLTSPLFADASGMRRFSAAAFYKRRALRILPLYWSVLAAAALLTSTSVTDALRIVPWFFFLQSFPFAAEPVTPFTNVTWSLATEAQFYLLHVPILASLPLWLYALATPSPEHQALVATGAVLAAVVTCVAAAALSYRWIERPFLVRKAKVRA